MSILSGTYIASGYTLPSQMIPLKEKDEDWKKDTMDSLETIAQSQRNINLNLIENYEMVKGKFIFSHYFGKDVDDGYGGMLGQLSKEFELPHYLKHYDIISPVINTLLGEWQKMPDVFRVKDWSDHGTNEFLRVKTDLLTSHLQETINIEINKKLLQSGIMEAEPQTEEEVQQIEQQIEAMRASMTPPQIESYMKTDFMTAAEKWGQHKLEADKQRFALKEKERKEFEDMLISDRCYRHFYLTATGYSQETWNPIQVFYHKSPEVEYIEDGDYVGRIFSLTLSDIIDRYGYLMKKEELESLTGEAKKKRKKWSDEVSGYEYVYDNYMVPFRGYPAYKAMQQVGDAINNESGVPYMDTAFLNNLTRDGFFTTNNGYYQVTEAYWKSYEKIILLTYMNEETGETIKKLVDENFIIPKHFSESKTVFSDEQDINTYTCTWVTRVYKGIKINLGNREQSLYIDVNPLKFQFKGDLNIYGAKLPVCGQIFSVRNSRSMALVDMMKPHQVGYNVAMNQLYQIAEKEIGAFIAFDVNMFPNSKDWGGEDAMGKWMTVAKALGVLPMDTSPTNTKGSLAATGGQFPKVIDLELGAQMVSRMNMAKFFEEQALKQVGFNAYRLGNYASTSTAAGIEQGAAQSYSQTDTYFTNFSNYLRRCYRMNLDIAQYVESKQKDVIVSFTNSDLTNSFLKVLGTDLLFADLYLFVSNSQEMLRQLESLRQLGMNNTSGATISDLAELMTTNSPNNILKILKESVEKQEAIQQQAQQLEQQKLEQAQQAAILTEQKLDERQEKKLENEVLIAQINASSKIFFNRNYSPSEEDIDSANENIDIQQQKVDNDKELKSQQLENDNSFKREQLSLENKKVDAQIQKEKDDIRYAQIMKGQKKP